VNGEAGECLGESSASAAGSDHGHDRCTGSSAADQGRPADAARTGGVTSNRGW